MRTDRSRTARWRTMATIGAVTAVAAAVAGLSQVPLAQAADPGSGEVRPAARTAAWDGQPYAAAATADPALCPDGAADPDDTLCDHYRLRVPVDAAYWDTHRGGAEVTVSWADAVDDFDLYVYDADSGDLVASSASGSTTRETATVPEANGSYDVRVVPFLVENSGYRGNATFTSRTGGVEPVALSGPREYHGTRLDDDVACPTAPCLPDREARNRAIDSPFPSLVLKSGPVGRDSAEPTIGVDKQGRAFYAAATFDSDLAPGTLADTRLLRSTDQGSSWRDVTSEPVPGQDFPFTLDPYVYVEEFSGRVFDLDLYVGDAYLSFSDDAGRTWETNPIAGGGLTDPVQDHQTLFAGPVPAGSPLVTTDPDFKEILYYCYNQVSRVGCTRSLDGGRTFATAGSVPYPGVEPMEGGAFCGGLHGHVATDRDGRVFLPKGHCGYPYLARSTDAALSWQRGRVSDRIDMPDNQSSVAADHDGNLFYVWYDSQWRLPWLAVSRTHGRTWEDPIMIAPPGVHEVQWPTVAAGGRGSIAIGFPSTNAASSGDLTRPWDYQVVESTNALSANPTFVSNVANPPGDPVHRGDCPGRCGNMLDFLDVIVSPAAGHAAWATIVDTCTAVRSCRSDDGARGFDEDDSTDGAARDMRGLFVKQIGGPRLRW